MQEINTEFLRFLFSLFFGWLQSKSVGRWTVVGSCSEELLVKSILGFRLRDAPRLSVKAELGSFEGGCCKHEYMFLKVAVPWHPGEIIV